MRCVSSATYCIDPSFARGHGRLYASQYMLSSGAELLPSEKKRRESDRYRIDVDRRRTSKLGRFCGSNPGDFTSIPLINGKSTRRVSH